MTYMPSAPGFSFYGFGEVKKEKPIYAGNRFVYSHNWNNDVCTKCKYTVFDVHARDIQKLLCNVDDHSHSQSDSCFPHRHPHNWSNGKCMNCQLTTDDILCRSHSNVMCTHVNKVEPTENRHMLPVTMQRKIEARKMMAEHIKNIKNDVSLKMDKLSI